MGFKKLQANLQGPWVPPELGAKQLTTRGQATHRLRDGEDLPARALQRDQPGCQQLPPSGRPRLALRQHLVDTDLGEQQRAVTSSTPCPRGQTPAVGTGGKEAGRRGVSAWLCHSLQEHRALGRPVLCAAPMFGV